MIVPTIGRNVWYRPSEHDLNALGMVQHAADQAFDAHIVFVWSPQCINLVVFDHAGTPYKRTSVPINVDDVSPNRTYGIAEWMPYQIGQAVKPV